MNAQLSKNSCLNVNVSAWASYYEAQAPKQVNLLTWLNSPKYAQQVEAIRAAGTKAERDKLKALLPAITPSGIFSRRDEAGLIQHSGLIQIDVDWKENAHIGNYTELKAQLAKLQNIAYLGLSVSGTGFWGLVPILYPEKHKAHFKALKTVFLRIGVCIDDKPGNVASLRGYSWDKEPYFNHNAKPFTLLEEQLPERYQPKATHRAQSSEADKVEAILRQAEAAGLDITPGYGTWFSLGCALANEFGEAGREYFHRVSQFHPGYNSSGTDSQFTACLKHRYSYTLGTFYEVAQQRGLNWKKGLGDQPNGFKSVQKIAPSKQGKEKPTQKIAEAIQANPEPIPPGFALVREDILEFEGLPWGWLSDSEQAEALARLKGCPAVSSLVERLGLVVDINQTYP